jgi:hypothetical protein
MLTSILIRTNMSLIRKYSRFVHYTNLVEHTQPLVEHREIKQNPHLAAKLVEPPCRIRVHHGLSEFEGIDVNVIYESGFKKKGQQVIMKCPQTGIIDNENG